MKFLSRAVKAYPAVALTVVVAAVALVMLATPARDAARWVVGIYALTIAAWQAVGMIRQLLRGHAGLDILAVTAITAAVLVGEPWAAIVVVLMLTGGEALEDYAENRSKRELTALLGRAPQQATRLLADGETETIAAQDVRIGDELLVRPGEQVPVDAVLVGAEAEFDQSSLTGESLPVLHRAGERVASGAINGATAVRLRSIALAADSEYQRIVALVAEATESKARVVRLADRYAVPFTLVSLAIAGLAWYLSGDPVRFAEVLVVATPCPLLIAAPVAFLGGMSRAARAGVIVKGGGTLEQLARVKAVAFDKTGTLTTGHPTLERVDMAAGFTEAEVLRYAASAEVYSSHVLAESVVATARGRELELLEVDHAEEHATNGVEAHTSSGVVRVGKPAWVENFTTELQAAPLGAGELAIYVSLDDRYVGALIMRDSIRPDAKATIDALRTLGIEEMLLVTGDVESTARSVANELGIETVYSECRPSDKVDIVHGVTTRPLLMAGDGLNDAPVLAAADVGFAMGARGSTAASESADIVNRFDSLAALPRVIHIARDTIRIALQSIWLGIAISVGLMLVAAAGFLPALAGAWLQEVVDLVAILGALRAVGPRSERK